jgi:hypothetical protein
MARDTAQLRTMLQEQMSLLRTSLDSFYKGNFGESLRIATTIRVLLHETKRSTSLLQQLTQDPSKLQILDSGRRSRPGDDEVFRFTLGLRLGPDAAVWPAVDLGSSHYSVSTIGTWWRRIVFKFNSAVGPQVNYRRNEVVLMLANREGGAHVDPNENPDYVRLLKDLPLGFAANGIRIQTPDLARFVTAQAGLEMLECLKRNFFPHVDIPLKWECGVAPPVAGYIDEISAVATWVSSAFPQAEMHITRRG